MSTSPREGSANGLEEKPRLSEHEKKANHIASGECSASSRSMVSNVAMANCSMQSKSVDKQFAKASTASLNWYLDWKAKGEVRVLS